MMFKKILLVDDDPFARKLIRGILSTVDTEVIEAVNGSQAIDYTRRYMPDLIILDVIMPEGEERVETSRAEGGGFGQVPDYAVMDVSVPGGNGIDAARVIKNEFPNVPIIGISGAESAFQTTLGANDYLQVLKMVGADVTLLKPVSREALLLALEDVESKVRQAAAGFEEPMPANLLHQKKHKIYNWSSNASDPVPENLPNYLNTEQLATIDQMENYGWKLIFVRRANPNNIIAFMQSPTGENTAIIEADGEFNLDHHVFIRRDQ